MVEQKILDDFVGAIKQEPVERNNVHSAEVARIDSEGTVWVYVEGSDKETPTVSSSAEVKKGDAVNVEWRNNKLYIAGNYSNPSAGVTRVSNVEAAAQAARQAASNAVADAGVAREAAASAQTSATEAKTIAESVEGIATRAEESAATANSAARTAVYGLSEVEDVVGTIRWIERNGIYEKTEDEYVKKGKAYYELINGSYVMVTNPVQEDLSEYYELRLSDTVQNYILSHLTVDDSGLSLRADNVNSRLLISNGLYKLTEDITVDASKNYYTRSGTEGSYTYTKVSNPIASELATYYEAIIEPGLTLYGPDGKEVANYGEEAQIGKSDGYNIKIRSGESNARLSFCLGDLEVAYMSGDMLYIPKAVVVDAMQVGDGSTGSAWQWVIKDPSSPYAGNLTLTWMGA